MLLRNIKWINYLDIHILDPKKRNDFFKIDYVWKYTTYKITVSFIKKSEYMPKILLFKYS